MVITPDFQSDNASSILVSRSNYVHEALQVDAPSLEKEKKVQILS